MSWQQVYWLTRLDAINVFFQGLCILLVMAAMAFLIWGGMSWDDATDDSARKRAKGIINRGMRFLVAAILIGILVVFIPNTKEAAAIYLIPKVVNNEHTKNISEKGLKLLEAKFDEWLKDTMAEEKKE